MGLLLALPVTWSHLLWEWGRLRSSVTGWGFYIEFWVQSSRRLYSGEAGFIPRFFLPHPQWASCTAVCWDVPVLLGTSFLSILLRGRRELRSNRRVAHSECFCGNHRGNLSLNKAARLGSMMCSLLGWGQELDLPLPTPVSREVTLICHCVATDDE